MKRIALGVFICCMIIATSAQKIKVKYTSPISDISSATEELYIAGTKVLSIRDSVIVFKDQHFEGAGISSVRTNDPVYKIYYLKSLNEPHIQIVTKIKEATYLVEDNIPPVKWEINYRETKQIKNFKCFQAKTYFRGSTIVAFFTKEIPYSYGPFKFSGLPGLILELHEENNLSNSWNAEVIDLNYTGSFPIVKYKVDKKITLREFLEIDSNENDKVFEKLTSNLPKNVKIERSKIQRGGELRKNMSGRYNKVVLLFVLFISSYSSLLSQSLRVIYNYQYKIDSLNRNEKNEEVMILDILNDRRSYFYSYEKSVYDSIIKNRQKERSGYPATNFDFTDVSDKSRVNFAVTKCYRNSEKNTSS